MKKGFTIIELLVASLLLGMLVTILTMVFNQSSIAWRTGIAGTTDLGEARRDISLIRDEADNIFPTKQRAQRLLGLWRNDSSDDFRYRACTGSDEQVGLAMFNEGNIKDVTKLDELPPHRGIANESMGSASHKTYIVNVMSAGPDRIFDTYDDIWSFPDEFE